MHSTPKPFLLLMLFAYWWISMPMGFAQQWDDPALRGLIQRYKAEAKGPYEEACWFCEDGTKASLETGCEGMKGLLMGCVHSAVTEFEQHRHVYLGHLLSNSDFAEVWDEGHEHARLKQYQLIEYLRSMDDGWIWRKARFQKNLRFQEAEAQWGKEFYLWLLGREGIMQQDYYLVRQSMRAIPYQTSARQEAVYSKVLARSADLPSFGELRNKLLGWPDSGDIQRIKNYQSQRLPKLAVTEEALNELSLELDSLVTLLKNLYAPLTLGDLGPKVDALPETLEIRAALTQFVKRFGQSPPTMEKLGLTSAMMWRIRKTVVSEADPATRLKLLDLSLLLEDLLLSEATRVKVVELGHLTRLTQLLAQACAATGELEMWEWEQIAPRLNTGAPGQPTLSILLSYEEAALDMVRWAGQMAVAHYTDVQTSFAGFEPLAGGFITHIQGTSLAHQIGFSAQRLRKLIRNQASWDDQVPAGMDAGAFTGMRPGFALGTVTISKDSANRQPLLLIQNTEDDDKTSTSAIISIGTGHPLMAAQQLAAQANVPHINAASDQWISLKALAGQDVFMGVSPMRNLTLKLAKEMTEEERALFDETPVNEEPEYQLNISTSNAMDIRGVIYNKTTALCGPMGRQHAQLKHLFPAEVSNGVVVPFGAFRAHMDQAIPGQKKTYWQLLKDIYKTAGEMRGFGMKENEVQQYLSDELEAFHALVQEMPLTSSFMLGFQQAFESAMGERVGQVPVLFYVDLVADTASEQAALLADVGLSDVVQHIRNAWARPFSPEYAEWRRVYLKSLENAYPALLILPAFDWDIGGHIRVPMGTSSTEALFVELNRGLRCATHSAYESWAIQPDGRATLMQPSRCLGYASLTGTNVSTSLQKPILSEFEKKEILRLVKHVHSLPADTPGIPDGGTLILEIGFHDGDIHLLGIREQSATSPLLLPDSNVQMEVPLTTKVPAQH